MFLTISEANMWLDQLPTEPITVSTTLRRPAPIPLVDWVANWQCGRQEDCQLDTQNPPLYHDRKANGGKPEKNGGLVQMTFFKRGDFQVPTVSFPVVYHNSKNVVDFDSCARWNICWIIKLCRMGPWQILWNVQMNHMSMQWTVMMSTLVSSPWFM